MIQDPLPQRMANEPLERDSDRAARRGVRVRTATGRSAAALLAFALHTLTPASVPASEVERARLLMGTICIARAEAADTSAAATAIAASFDEIARLEEVLSSWRDDSELMRLNASGAEGMTCSGDLHAALDSALALAAVTGGAFDPTVEPLDLAWDARGSGRVPGDDELERAVSLVDWRGLALDTGTRRARFARAGMGVDLGGIGKGFALDRIAPPLREAGITRALVNFGGEVLALGRWDVTVADPLDRLRAVARLEVEDAAVSTSAQGERGIVAGGRHYGHILDPANGRPVEWTGSVTVIAPSATRADALSTALLVMGRERAAAFAARNTGIGVLWLEPHGNTLRAWCWNLARPAAEPGARIEWMESSQPLQSEPQTQSTEE